MKIHSSLILILFLFGCVSSNKFLYISKEKPTFIPKLFEAGFISKDSVAEFGSVFNKAGDEFYFGVDLSGRAEIRYSKLNGHSWTAPATIFSDSLYSFNDPFLSLDGNRLYYISDLPRNEQDTTMDYDIWYSEKNGLGWSAPINAGEQINSDANDFYISFTNDGALYFATNKDAEEKRKHDFDLYRSEMIDGVFQKAEWLPGAINTKWRETDPFVAPDGSYLIFCSWRKSGFGKGDLYISFKNDDGTWSAGKNMGDQINTAGYELCPFVSRDGKYFFYTSEQDIYWVSGTVIAGLKE